MNNFITLVSRPRPWILRQARSLWTAHRPLAGVTAGSVILLIAALILQTLDGRIIQGSPAWMKPAKFAASIAVAAPVLAWIVAQMREARRYARLHKAASVIAALSLLELVIITVQAARGIPSHFNNATTIDAALFSVMGVAITVFWLAEVIITIGAFRFSFATPVRTWGIRLGLVGTLLGAGMGFLMPRPTPDQLESLSAGRATPALGAHGVGVPDGGPGLPVTRWSVQGGDLRVPHFIGLHALQGLPLAAILLERRRRRVARGSVPTARAIQQRDTQLVLGLGVAWVGVTLVTLWQALRGQPVVAPDAATMLAFLTVLTSAMGIAFFRSNRQPAGARIAGSASRVEVA